MVNEDNIMVRNYLLKYFIILSTFLKNVINLKTSVVHSLLNILKAWQFNDIF